MDEKSLIKKYQKEISILKQELQQLKRGMMENPLIAAPNQEDLVNLKLQVRVMKRDQLINIFFFKFTLLLTFYLYNTLRLGLNQGKRFCILQCLCVTKKCGQVVCGQ